jgi:hypothetical protein
MVEPKSLLWFGRMENVNRKDFSFPSCMFGTQDRKVGDGK